MQKLKIAKSLQPLLTLLLTLNDIQKAAVSEYGKHKTITKNAMRENMAAEGNVPGTFYMFNGMRIAYETAVTDQIHPKDLYDELQAGKITEEQFLRCVKVSIGDTKEVLGGDVVEALKQPTAGKELDIRITALPVEEATGNFMIVPDKPKVKRRVLGASGNLQDKPRVSAKPKPVNKTRKLNLARK